MKRDKKVNLINGLTVKFQENKTFFLLDYDRMKVSQSVELRKALRKNSFSLKVVKNRLALRALSKDFPEELRESFKKPTAIAFTDRDAVGMARLIREFSLQNRILAVKGGVLDGQAFPASRFEEICKLSSREEMIGKIAFLMAFPLTKLLRTWQAPLNQIGVLLSQLNQLKNKNSVGG